MKSAPSVGMAADFSFTAILQFSRGATDVQVRFRDVGYHIRQTVLLF
jgi:hypothetical protein